MTRFAADEPADRRKLFVEAIVAHRNRASPHVTIEVEVDEGPAPWVQFADGRINADCTEAELEELKTLLGRFPAFKIDELTRPDDAEGVNVRVSAKADPNRIAGFIDTAFREVYGLPEGYRAWVVAI